MRKLTRILFCIALFAIIGVGAMGCAKEGANGIIYTVSVVGGNGGGQYYENINCTVTAEVPAGKQFMKWTIDGEEVSAKATFVFTVKKDTNIMAVFEDLPDSANKEVYSVNAQNGIGSGGYLQGSSCTVKTLAKDSDRRFKSWATVIDGAVAKEVSTANPYVFTVNQNVVLQAQFYDTRLLTPKNEENQILYIESGYTTAFDRMKDEDGNALTMFVDGVDYVTMYMYDDRNAVKDDFVAKFKFYVVGNDGYFENFATGAKLKLTGAPGNFYVDINTPRDTYFNFYKGVLGDKLISGTEYLFSAQAMAKSKSAQVGTQTELCNSELSAIGSKGIVVD